MQQSTWDIFDTWSIQLPPEPDWKSFDSLVLTWTTWLDSLRAPLTSCIEAWDAKLANYGGDPGYTDWSKFRLLRLNYENDWSDMLAWLISNSVSGLLARNLLKIGNRPPGDYATPEVEREYPTPEGYRADMVIKFRPENGIPFYSHIEVKIDDDDLMKTLETGNACRRRCNSPRDWNDFILLKKENLGLWQGVVEKDPASESIGTLSWDDVVIAIRNVLWMGCENIKWNTWAWTLTGAIEQKILYIPPNNREMTHGLDQKLRILKEGASHG